jgi:hypothetical protein
MTAAVFLGFSTLFLSVVTAVWAIIRDKNRDKARESLNKASDDAKLRDDQREWYETMSHANKAMMERVESLERDRIADHKMIADLRNYVRRLVAAMEREKVTVPPAPKNLEID